MGVGCIPTLTTIEVASLVGEGAKVEIVVSAVAGSTVIRRKPGVPFKAGNRIMHVEDTLSLATYTNGVIYIIGHVGAPRSPSVVVQMEDCLRKIDTEMGEHGLTKKLLLTFTIYIRDFQDYKDVNDAYQKWVDPANKPVRTLIAVKTVGWSDSTAKIEVKATAAGSWVTPITRTPSSDGNTDSLMYNGVVYLGGVVADRATWGLAGEAAAAFKKVTNLLAVYSDVGAGQIVDSKRILTMNLYLKDMTKASSVMEAYKAWIDTANLPAWTVVAVNQKSSTQSSPEIELEITAAGYRQ